MPLSYSQYWRKMADKKIKILFLGDLAGKPGRLAVQNFLIQKPVDIDFVIANVENASHGFGLTAKNYDELSSCGIDCMTSGNHIWDKKDIFEYIERAEKLIRPANYPEAPGKGYRIFDVAGCKIGVINALGRTFMPVIDSPLYIIEKIINEIKEETNIIFIDFHGEATAEKLCYGRYFSALGISAFVGTHTHVQTADETIINGRTAYITDVGFCGDADGIIGMDYESSLKHIITMMPGRFEVAASGNIVINGVSITIDKTTGFAEAIERINIKTKL